MRQRNVLRKSLNSPLLIGWVFAIGVFTGPLWSLASGPVVAPKTSQISCQIALQGPLSAYEKFSDLRVFNEAFRQGLKLPDRQDRSFGNGIPIVRSFEKEGLYYQEIAQWFPSLRPSGKEKLQERLNSEKQAVGGSILIDWLKRIQIEGPQFAQEMWRAADVEARIDILLKREDPFELLSVADREFLFENNILNFNDIKEGSATPSLVTVGDDLGSYEVRLSRGIIDRYDFLHLREQVEQYLEGRVGHQHLFHAWPTELGIRKEITPYYIELLDSTTWYLYWRQMGRDPNEVDSILTHPFLGVYTRSSLNRLAKAVEKNDPKRFRDKYRMVGARNFPASKELPEQVEPLVPDWEIRSGNKGQRREFVENLLVARLSTGDYSGLRSYQSYEFNPSASIRELLNPWLGDQVREKDVALLERFQSTHPMMKWSPHAKALNHTRNRIMSPLLPWENRLNLEFKEELLGQAKIRYLGGLIGVARTFERDLAAHKISKKEARQKAVDSLEQLIFDFSKVARLDLDFERYLNPVPGRVPDIQLQGPVGPVDINNLDLGIEYSFRMPFEMTPESRDQAAAQIQGFAESFAAKESGAPIQSANGDSHGHGLAVKFKVMDRDQAAWRFEWDGIQRNYDAEGKILNAWGGHIEVVTPKFSPQSVQGPISALFAQSRARGLQPRRSAGGAHINFDLTPLMKNEPAILGTRRVVNLISYFESTEPVILFLWQHPKRRHAAYPVSVSAESARRLYEFEGDWKQLGQLLYEIRYFNTYIGRKPKYVPLNLTSLMTSIVPDAYLEKTLDIRNGTQAWFPNFNKVYDRGEARLFDAPSDEAVAALQIKYFRALLNKGFNSEKRILLVQRFNAQDVENWKRDIKAWLKVAEEHLLELGLDPQEFRSVLWDSWQIQTSNEPSARTLTPYQEFLPAKD